MVAGTNRVPTNEVILSLASRPPCRDGTVAQPRSPKVGFETLLHWHLLQRPKLRFNFGIATPHKDGTDLRFSSSNLLRKRDANFTPGVPLCLAGRSSLCPEDLLRLCFESGAGGQLPDTDSYRCQFRGNLSAGGVETRSSFAVSQHVPPHREAHITGRPTSPALPVLGIDSPSPEFRPRPASKSFQQSRLGIERSRLAAL